MSSGALRPRRGLRGSSGSGCRGWPRTRACSAARKRSGAVGRRVPRRSARKSAVRRTESATRATRSVPVPVPPPVPTGARLPGRGRPVGAGPAVSLPRRAASGDGVDGRSGVRGVGQVGQAEAVPAGRATSSGPGRAGPCRWRARGMRRVSLRGARRPFSRTQQRSRFSVPAASAALWGSGWSRGHAPVSLSHSVPGGFRAWCGTGEFVRSAGAGVVCKADPRGVGRGRPVRNGFRGHGASRTDRGGHGPSGGGTRRAGHGPEWGRCPDRVGPRSRTGAARSLRGGRVRPVRRAERAAVLRRRRRPPGCGAGRPERRARVAGRGGTFAGRAGPVVAGGPASGRRPGRGPCPGGAASPRAGSRTPRMAGGGGQGSAPSPVVAWPRTEVHGRAAPVPVPPSRGRGLRHRPPPSPVLPNETAGSGLPHRYQPRAAHGVTGRPEAGVRTGAGDAGARRPHTGASRTIGQVRWLVAEPLPFRRTSPTASA